MDARNINTPSTPTRTTSAGPISPHHLPMDDTDSSGTRKRPRLDSGERTYRSMSADRLQSSPSQPNSQPSISTIEDEKGSVEMIAAQPPMTPTKVTINVRDTQKSERTDAAGGQSTLPNGTSNVDHDASPGSPPSSPKVISVPSTPTGSPEIQVAEVEEIGDDTAVTRWRPLKHNALDSRNIQTNHLGAFPYLNAGKSLRKTVHNICAAIEKGDMLDGQIIERVADWIEHYLELTEPLSEFWWDMLSDEREFWDELPCIIDSIYRRGDTLKNLPPVFSINTQDRGSDTPDPLTRFLGSWAAIGLRMLDIDRQTLIDNMTESNNTPDLVSERYLSPLQTFLKQDPTFWKHIVDTRKFDVKGPILLMMVRLTGPPTNGLTMFTETSKDLLDRPINLANLIPKFQALFCVVSALATVYRQSLVENRVSLPTSLPSQFYDFFKIVDTRLQQLISKQVSSLTYGICQHIVLGLSNILQVVALADEKVARQLSHEKQLDTTDLANEERADLIYVSWKFETLKRCIMGGRMEIRVQGTEIMQLDLINNHRKYIECRHSDLNHPITVYLADFLIRNRFIPYLVGAESHSQLIQRSSNILGYLVVTQRLSNADLDVVWNAASANRESRSGEVITHMLLPCLNLCPYSTLCYLVDRLKDVPVDDFDAQMRDYTQSLLHNLANKWQDQIRKENPRSSERLDTPPFELCIRLLRQAATDGLSSRDHARAVRDFASQQLSILLHLGPSQDSREAILKRCLDDIAHPTMSATGSIAALHALIQVCNWNHKPQLIHHLTQDLDMTKILIDDLCRTAQEDREGHVQAAVSHERLQTRLRLLYSIILEASETFSLDITSRLWEALVGSQAPSEKARIDAWEMLYSVANILKSRNPFIDLCISEMLPKLNSIHVVPGCLDFVDAAREYIKRTEDSRTPDVQLNASTAAELLWHLALTIPKETPDLAKRATDMLIPLYLDSPDAKNRSREANDSLHIDLVERCIDKLGIAASKLKSFTEGSSSGEDEPMVMVATDEEVQTQKLCFVRSLMILKEFVQGVRQRTMYSPSPELPARLPVGFNDLKGESIKIRYQAHSENKGASSMNTFEVGGLETIEELSCKLATLTSFSKFKVYASGQEIHFANIADQQLKDSDFLTRGLLLIRKVASAESASSLSGLRPMEIEIMRHFDQLYQLLGMEDEIARQVLEFLTAFPPHPSMVELVNSPIAFSESVFPTIAPFRTLYSLHVLGTILTRQLQTHTVSLAFMKDTIKTLSSALTESHFNIGSDQCENDILVAGHLADCLSNFLKAVRDPESHIVSSDTGGDSASITSAESLSPFPNPSALINCCLDLLSSASAIQESDDAVRLIHGILITLIEASLISHGCWLALQGTGMLNWIIRKLLLEETTTSNRQAFAKTVIGACKSPSGKLPLYHEDIIIVFANAALEVVPATSEFSQSSQQFFEVALALLESLSRTHQQQLDIVRYIKEWSGLLFGHRHTEAVGRSEIDYFVTGLAHLVLFCIRMAKTFGTSVDVSDDLLEKLFQRQLFPSLEETECMPNLRSATRDLLYSIVLSLSNDLSKYHLLHRLVRDVSISGEVTDQAWSWGIAQPFNDRTLEPNWNFEPTRTLRSAAGYPGLRNLSNTCYMNSLFTQLFMNTRFRNFVLSVTVADGGTSQRLLHEIRTLFGFMQASSLKAIDTQAIAESIITYENSTLDVTHQVDVDEFFNLLFDRLESQILSEHDKKTFRRFFGGQIVQQIKSKECTHISERLEPFSAIQCDIFGKTTLMESLNAYVQGEAMEGDNKYSCTSCGKYVDAVKRACLKDIPDNIIFHLKRFDYDMIHGTRAKINDRFEFPLEIDMAPYNVECLKDTNEPSEADVFALVGVLVHSGTAESGHYYSYIQERSSGASLHKKWIEFNDMDVSEFNPAEIDGHCFGGWQEFPAYETRYAKLWNAYMLFYERVEVSATQEAQQSSLIESVTKAALPVDLRNDVDTHNQDYLRQYCLFDPAHATFQRDLLRQLRLVSSGKCSSNHENEKEAIWLGLEYLDKVLARLKETTLFDEMLSTLIKTIGPCSVCCSIALRWTQEHDYPLQNLLLRCPQPKVRKEFTSMIIHTLTKLRQQTSASDETHEHNSNEMPLEEFSEPSSLPRLLNGLVGRLRSLWDRLHTGTRAWDEYFGLLAEVAHMGASEAHLLLRHGFLQQCLELLVCEHSACRSLRLQQPYLSYCKQVEKCRKFSYNKLIELVANLFERIDFAEDVHMGEHYSRPFSSGKMPLTDSENQLVHFRQAGPKSICVFLEKILGTAANRLASKRIMRAMLLAEPDAKFYPQIQNTLKSGINIDPAEAAGPFLEAALTFCESTPFEAAAERMILDVASVVQTINDSGGKEHLEFFVQARRLRSLRGPFPHDFFHRCVLVSMQYWAPHLLLYWEQDVRIGTITLLRMLLLQYNIHDMDDEELADQYTRAGKKLGEACAKKCQLMLEAGKPVGRMAGDIDMVVRACIEQYFDDEDDEAFIQDVFDILDRLQALTVTDLEDPASDWDNSADLPSDSEDEAYAEM